MAFMDYLASTYAPNFKANPGESIQFPFKTTHPNVSISVFQQTTEIQVHPRNEFFEVILKNSIRNTFNGVGWKSLHINIISKNQIKLHVVLFFKNRFGIPHPRLKIQDGHSTLNSDWCWRTQQFSTRPTIILLAQCLSLTENAWTLNITRKLENSLGGPFQWINSKLIMKYRRAFL
jgi:hypothetical protein